MQLRRPRRRLVGPAPPVSLEISLAPGDLRHLPYTLPHQLRRWAPQVQEVVCTVDLEPTPGVTPPPPASARADLLALIERSTSAYQHARTDVVDYSKAAARGVAEAFFGGVSVPSKTFRGGPFYAYFFGLHRSSHDYVLHMDSDMLFGGGSTTWVREAVELLRRDEDVLIAGPFPGPPRPDGAIMQAAEPEKLTAMAYSFPTVTTRIYLVDRRRLVDRICPLTIRRHEPVRTRVRTNLWLEELRRTGWRALRRPLTVATLPYDLPERLLGEAMAVAGLRRIAFLGRTPGMWSLHPRDRTDRFYARLDRLVERVEQDDVPDEQRGHYDMIDSMLG